MTVKPIDTTSGSLSVSMPDGLTYQNVREIAELVQACAGFASVDIELGDIRISVLGRSAQATAGEELPAEGADVVTASAPGLGLFRCGTAADGTPLARVGRMVAPGDGLCAIEVLRKASDVAAEVAGEIVAVLAEEGALVEYGQPLVRIRRC